MRKPNHIDRRTFLRRLGIGAAATSAALAGCKSGKDSSSESKSPLGEVPTDKMTYRVNPKTGNLHSTLNF